MRWDTHPDRPLPTGWLHDRWNADGPLSNLRHRAGERDPAGCLETGRKRDSFPAGAATRGSRFNGRGTLAAAFRRLRWLYLARELRSLRAERGFSPAQYPDRRCAAPADVGSSHGTPAPMDGKQAGSGRDGAGVPVGIAARSHGGRRSRASSPGTRSVGETRCACCGQPHLTFRADRALPSWRHATGIAFSFSPAQPQSGGVRPVAAGHLAHPQGVEAESLPGRDGGQSCRARYNGGTPSWCRCPASCTSLQRSGQPWQSAWNNWSRIPPCHRFFDLQRIKAAVKAMPDTARRGPARAVEPRIEKPCRPWPTPCTAPFMFEQHF